MSVGCSKVWGIVNFAIVVGGEPESLLEPALALNGECSVGKWRSATTLKRVDSW